jgi:hypothetical protein
MKYLPIIIAVVTAALLLALALGCGNTTPISGNTVVNQFGSSTQPAQIIINGSPGMIPVAVTVNLQNGAITANVTANANFGKMLATRPAMEQP